MRGVFNMIQKELVHHSGISQSQLSKLIHDEVDWHGEAGERYLDIIAGVFSRLAEVPFSGEQLRDLEFSEQLRILKKEKKKILLFWFGLGIGKWRMAIWLGVAILLLLAMFLPDWTNIMGSSSRIPLNELPEVDPIYLVKAEITEPKDGQEVPQSVSCQGTVSGLKANHHLWLVVEIDDQDGSILGYWPKGHQIIPNPDGSWSHEIFQHNRNDSIINLALYVVKDSMHAMIDRWIQESSKTDSFPSFDPITGKRRLKRIDGLRVKFNNQQKRK